MLVLGKGRLRFLRYQAIGRFQRHSASHICGIVTGQRFTQGIQRSDLGDDIKVGADAELKVDVRNGSSRAPNFELVRHTVFATAPILPRRRLSIVMNQCTLPSRCVGRTIASSRQIGTSILSLRCPSFLRLRRVRKREQQATSGEPKDYGPATHRAEHERPPAQHPSGARPRTPQDRLPIHRIVTDSNERWARLATCRAAKANSRSEPYCAPSSRASSSAEIPLRKRRFHQELQPFAGRGWLADGFPPAM